jgi:hypothetical protein
MARGWESKSVESQMEDRQDERETPSGSAPVRDLELERQRYSLELSRRRVESELAGTQSSLRRASLEQALKYLDAELAKLSS